MATRISWRAGTLVAEATSLLGWLSRGVSYRKIMVDQRLGEVRILTRTGWARPVVRHVPFDQVCAVLYRFENVTRDSVFTAENGIDCYTVELQVRPRERVLLARFRGACRDPGYEYDPDAVLPHRVREPLLRPKDLGAVSLAFAEAVSGLIGVTIEDAPIPCPPRCR